VAAGEYKAVVAGDDEVYRAVDTAAVEAVVDDVAVVLGPHFQNRILYPAAPAASSQRNPWL
jgi:hypothetical protein